VELHTGTYCEAPAGRAREAERQRLVTAARQVAALGMECHAGHGLNYETAAEMAAVAEIGELNIGHFLIGQAVFDGLPACVERMKQVMQEARR
jgi:pyridoxine 5-phosphate synthase